MVPRKSIAWTLLALLAGTTVGACGKSDGPASPLLDATSGNTWSPGSGVPATTPVPSTLAASRVFEVVGDPSCCTLPNGPYARFGFRLAEVSSGFHPLTAAAGTGTCNAPPQDPDNGITLTLDAGAITWTSTMPVGAVIIGSSVGARVYVYSPRSWGDAGLRAPLDPATSAPAAITSLELCYDYALRVQAAVQPIWSRTTQWTLAQTVAPQQWDLFPGDVATSRATVDVAPTGVIDTPPTVNGTVTIQNATPLPATISSITNVISVGLVTPLSCGLTLPYVLPAGQSLTCTFTRQLPDASTRTDMVTVNTTSVVLGGSGSTRFSFGAQALVNTSVHVSTSDGQTFGPFDAAASFSYDHTFEAVMVAGASVRTLPLQATLEETQQVAASGVTLQVWVPELTHELQPSFRRTWQWSLVREVALSDATLHAGESLIVDGQLRIAATSDGGSDFQVAGQAIIRNPHPTRALVVSGLEARFPMVEITVAGCAAGFEVPPGGSVACALSATLPDGSARTSRVAAAYQNQVFAADGTLSPGASTTLEHTLGVVFDQPTVELDRCVEVHDDAAGIATALCADVGDVSIPAPLTLGPYAGCGEFTMGGIAELLALDTGTRTQVAYAVVAIVPCTQGCTEGKGYWKTHSLHGTRSYDATWERLPAGADTPLFASGRTYFDALWGGRHGDAWLQLAGHWVAAQMNQLAGADPSAVAADYTEAEELLRSTQPGAVGTDLQGRMRELMRVLEAWNEGEIGPGSCDATP